MRGRRSVMAGLAGFALVAAACGGGGGSTSTGGGGPSAPPAMIHTIGPGEGALNLIAWPGYTEKSWVKPFEKETGCKLAPVKYGNTSDEMVNLMRQGGGTLFDGASASGDATNRLIAAGDVAPIDVNLFPEYQNMMQTLQSPPHNTVNGIHYGVPYEWGPNFLMFNTNVVTAKPNSWDVVFEKTINGQPNPYWGKVTAYDSAIYIADAALYLKAHNASLGITDPYELTPTQLDAAVNLLKQQATGIKKYWAYYTDEIKGFDGGDMVVGTAWPVNQQYIQADKKVPVASVYPSEGVTGWADTWVMSSHAQHPNCMLKWMAYTTRPEVQTAVAEFYGATPSNSKSCPQLQKDLGKVAELFHCGDDAFLSTIKLWKTPLTDCGDSRGNTCTNYTTWSEKWTEIRGA